MGAARDWPRGEQYRDVPSRRDEGPKPEERKKRLRHPGRVLFGYFLLHEQEKVSRPRFANRKKQFIKLDEIAPFGAIPPSLPEGPIVRRSSRREDAPSAFHGELKMRGRSLGLLA